VEHPDDTTNGPSRARRLFAALGAVAASMALVVLVASVTGLPGPGPIRRYPTRDLDHLADRINAGTRDPRFAPCLGPGDIATVDPIRSRVIITKALPFALDKEEAQMVQSPNGNPQFVAVACDVD
jgi:hypothetical protein